MRALLRAAAVEAGIPDERVEDLTDVGERGVELVEGVAVPEHSVPSESQSNGAAERIVQMVGPGTGADDLS